MANPAGTFHFFDSNKGAATTTERRGGSVLEADISIKGSLKTGGDIVIAGTIEGDVAAEGRVTVVSGGRVVGSISATEIVLGGKVEGNSVATKALSLLASAEVRGDVSTPQIVIEPGATFVGRCSMPQSA